MDLTVAAIPMYFGGMGAEARWLQRRAEIEGPSSADYERDDTLANLAMGVGSLVIGPLLIKGVAEFRPRAGRLGRVAAGVSGVAALAVTIADVVERRRASGEPGAPGSPGEIGETGETGESGESEGPAGGNRSQRRWWERAARAVQRVGGPVAVGGAWLAITSSWTGATGARRMFGRRIVRDLGSGPLAALAAVAGWDFIYYWNHRFMHEWRYMWAVHVVHHSSERYNLSTALRQTWSDALGTFVPYGVLAALGLRPGLIEQARGINLIYQFWIHTDAVRTLGPLEKVLNTASHHRVHHGANPQYLDKNYGSILITWDKLFGTFEAEDEPVVYGLTKNLDTDNPAVIATREYADIMVDVANSSSWRERLSFVLRGPGWAFGHTRRTYPDPPVKRVPLPVPRPAPV